MATTTRAPKEEIQYHGRLCHIPEAELKNYRSQHKLTSIHVQSDAMVSSMKKHFKFPECGHQCKIKTEEPGQNGRQLKLPCGRIRADSPVAVQLNAENKNMGGVKISKNGDLSIGHLGETPSIIKFLNDTDSFLWQSQGTVKNASEEYLYFDFQSDEYKDLYIAADTIGNYIVKGMTKQQMADKSNSYWRSREFSKVASADYDSSWIALQYWGKNRPDDPTSLEGYYLVVEGKPPATAFKLADKDTAAKHGAFSYGCL